MGNIDYLRTMRRTLHKLAEPTDGEYRTGDCIAAELKRLGHKCRRMHTGVVCDVKGEDTSRKVALRADIDALPLRERSDCPFKAEGEYMHACGHDGHTAMLLEMAAQLAVRKPRTDVRLIFQFGEEGDGGADKMIGMGAIDGVDEIYAFHMCPELELGKVASTSGAMFAGTVEFDVEFSGKSAHCASVGAGADALGAATYFAAAAAECNADCRNNTLFHIGKLSGGTARNIVADSATALCTLRYFDSADTDKLMMRLERYLVEADNRYNTDHRLTVHAVYPPLVNHESALNKVRALTEVLPCAPRFTAEDFAFYLQKIPGCMLWLGCRDARHVSPLHSDTFGFDESALLYGVRIYEQLIFGD